MEETTEVMVTTTTNDLLPIPESGVHIVSSVPVVMIPPIVMESASEVPSVAPYANQAELAYTGLNSALLIMVGILAIGIGCMCRFLKGKVS
jgi:hypothetical protein